VSLLVATGCGLSDYAAKMSSQKARAVRFDEEEKNLGEVAKMPVLPTKEGKEESWNVFLRLPKDVLDKPVTQDQSNLAQLHGGLLAEYRGKGAGAFQGVFLGVDRDRKDFRKEVLNLFPASGEIRPSETKKIPGPESELIFERNTFDDSKSTLSINFCQRSGFQVAVVFRVKKGGMALNSRAIDLSLETLGVGSEVSAQRARYEKTHRTPITKK
jgi:hypothetical protein